jgi:hypothetical protein
MNLFLISLFICFSVYVMMIEISDGSPTRDPPGPQDAALLSSGNFYFNDKISSYI